MAHRPFRFGIPLGGGTPAELLERARTAEGLGYSTLQAFDQLALDASTAVPLLGFAAAATTTILLSAYVFDNGYRHPVILAKEAAMLDVLSGGRLELGLGAGYSAEEYRGSGLAFPAGPERAARLEEAVSLLKAVFEGGPVTLRGRYYPLDAYQPAIRPVQSPRPRLMLGAARRRLLALAGREADIASLAVTDWHDNATLDATRQKIAWLRGAAGERFHDIEIETLVQMRSAPSREAAIAEASARSGRAQEWYDSPYWVGGTAEEIAETLRERRRDLGISYISVRPRERMRDFADVIRLLV